MSKKLLGSLFVILVIVLVIIVIYKQQSPQADYSPTTNSNNNTASTTTQSSDNHKTALPVALDNPNVGSVLIHYFFSGTLKQIETVSGGNRIVLQNSAGMPDLLITSVTRVSKITPPYDKTTPVPINIKDLKSGEHLDISAEYDLNQNIWFFRDVFLATDKN